ncbi:response regulator [Rheinheimera faecalis]|uniref:response regulator n=1 Tax=Rheinheimera faecalis TaxID=2901141 RepID=UPI001E6413B4|nr:response regulator [Rheinheimera faecalis]
MSYKTLENLRVLIVDDQRPFQLLLKGILYSMGATNIAFVLTGEQALWKCMHGSYDVLFVDYNLGSGKNGRQLLEDLREKKLLHPGAVYMIVTGENQVPMVVGAIEAEPDDYIIKPFSQSVLRTRLVKIQNRKKQLAPIYQAMFDDQPELVIEACKQEREQVGRYHSLCGRIQAETHLKLKQYDEAEALLSETLSFSRTNWALLLQARLCFEQERFDESMELCNEAIDTNRYFAEAYDLKARNLIAQGLMAEAMEVISQAIVISPFSVSRQNLVMDIARDMDDLASLVQASKQIYEITRRAARQEVVHLLNYIRTVIDAASRSEELNQRNKYQQEALMAIHRAKREDTVIRDFDFDLFETLCQARLESLSGQQYLAKKTFATVSDRVTAQMNPEIDPEKPDEVPPIPHCAADAVLLLNQIGEFEQASALTQKLQCLSGAIDPILEKLFSEQQHRSLSRQASFNEVNKQGIQFYKESNYEQALIRFEQALEIAPMNTGSALNYIQTAIQMMADPKRKKPLELAEKCRKTFRIVDNMPLPEHHKVRHQELLQQFNKLKEEKRYSR